MDLFERIILLIACTQVILIAGIRLLSLDRRRRVNVHRRRKWWVKPIIGSRAEEGTANILMSKSPSDGFFYQKFFRVDKKTLEFLLNLISPGLQRLDTVRASIPVREKLAVTLRYLATGRHIKPNLINTFNS